MKTIYFLQFFIYLASISFSNNCEGYRILGVFPLDSKSHFSVSQALMKGLARKGHQVDVVSRLPQKRAFPNYTDIIKLPQLVPGLVNNLTYERYHDLLSHGQTQWIAEKCGYLVCQYLGHPAMIKLLRNHHHPPYDMVITEVLGAHCFMALGHYFNVPVIGISASELYPWANAIIANPANLAFAPDPFLNLDIPMTFLQRLYNTVISFYQDTMFHVWAAPQNEIIKKYLGKDAPTMREAERSIALIMRNTYPILNNPKPVTPALIEIGGLHIQEDESEVPQDLKKWMDDSTSGFIYFTFGSMVIIESFPKKIIQSIYKSLGKISPIRVLIKISNPEELPPGLPNNFRTSHWIPQIKVLQHKNIKGFITHGGLLSTLEAVHYGVPMIGIPLLADQFTNVNRCKKMNITIKLDSRDITEENLDVALKEILHNPLYKESSKKISAKFLDRPMSAMDTAVWWVEYIGRHGKDVLRSPAMDIAWWQIELLDVYGFILLIIILVVTLIIKLLIYLINICYTITSFKVRDSKKVQ